MWSGFKQVHTFIFSTLSTVSLSVKMNPPFSSAGRPLGKESSMTRYSHSSAFTKGATNVCFPVMMGAASSTPSFSSISSMD